MTSDIVLYKSLLILAVTCYQPLLPYPSGSRRFICIEVTGPIKTNVTISYRQLYAQAMHAISKGEEGEWMTTMEILSHLQTKTKDRLTINKVALFGRVLHKLGIENRRRNKGTEYKVMRTNEQKV